MARGLLSHLDLSVGRPAESIRFYDALLTALGYRRFRDADAAWQEPNPTRAAWGVRYPDGTVFGIDLRPAEHAPDRPYDRYEPGPHHVAFQVDADRDVDEIYTIMCQVGARVLDAPAEYGGQPGYGVHYYAVFFADPDGFKIEVLNATDLGA